MNKIKVITIAAFTASFITLSPYIYTMKPQHYKTFTTKTPLTPNQQHNINDALLHAIKYHDSYEASKALDIKADPNAVDNNNSCALALAAENGLIHVATLLLYHKADVNFAKNRLTPLKSAILGKHTEIAELLIDNNAEINTTKYGLTPLVHASLSGHNPMVQLLLDKKADVNLTGNGLSDTPLIFATLLGHAETVNLLLENKADVHATSASGNSALMIASQCNYHAIASKLVLAGANPVHRSTNGRTALDVAKTTAMRFTLLIAQLAKNDLDTTPTLTCEPKKSYSMARYRYLPQARL